MNNSFTFSSRPNHPEIVGGLAVLEAEYTDELAYQLFEQVE